MDTKTFFYTAGAAAVGVLVVYLVSMALDSVNAMPATETVEAAVA